MKTIKFNPEIHTEDMRCQAHTNRGLCEHISVKGTTRCPHHGANKQLEKQRRIELNNYKITKFKTAIGEDAARSLVDEVIVLKTVLNTIISKCESEEHLILHHESITDTVLKVEKVVNSLNKLDVLNRQMIQIGTVKKIIDEVFIVIDDMIDDKDVKDQIGDKIASIIDEATEVDEDEYLK
jgi:hypothetical protein